MELFPNILTRGAVWWVTIMYGSAVAGISVKKNLTITSSYPGIEEDSKGLVVR